MDWLSTLIDSFFNSDIGRLLVNFLRKVGENPKFDEFCLTLGAMIGTIIALVFTLSIIPIQRAVELLSPSVAAHYRRYWVLILIYAFLGISCILSFLTPLVPFIISGATASGVMILLLIGSVLTVFVHHWAVSKLVEPRSAIEYLRRVLLRDVRRFSSKKLTGRSSDSHQTANSNISAEFNRHMIELGAIARKTFDAGDLSSCYQAIGTIKEVTCEHLRRLEAEGLSGDGDLAHRTAALTFHWFETMHRHSALHESEEACRYIADAFGEITEYALRELKSLSDEAYNWLCNDAIVHLRICVVEAQHRDLDSVAVKLSGTILNLSRFNASRSVLRDASPQSHAMAVWGLFVKNFVEKGKFDAAESILEHMMNLLGDLMKRGQEDFYGSLHSILMSLNVFVQASLREGSAFSQVNGGRVPRAYSIYSAGLPFTFNWLARQAVMIETSSRNPLSLSDSPLRAIGMGMAGHIKELMNSLGVARRPIWHSIRQIVKCLLECYLKVIRGRDSSSIPRDEIVPVLRPLIYLFPKIVDRDYDIFPCVISACDDLAYAGISFFKEGLHPLAEQCAFAILAVVKSYTGGSAYVVEEAAQLVYFISYIERGMDWDPEQSKLWAPKISGMVRDVEIPSLVSTKAFDWRLKHGPQWENLEFDYSLVDAGGPETKNRAVKLLRQMFGTAQ